MPRVLLVLSIIIIATLCTACGDQPAPPPDTDAKFERMVQGFVESYLELHPEEATLLGDHRYDDRLSDYSAQGVASMIALREAYLDSLRGFKVEELAPENRIDHDILRHSLETDLFTLRELAPWRNNPLAYNPGNALYSIIARDFAPLPDRLRALEGRLRAIPVLLSHARSNLENPPSIHTETALQQNAGTRAMIATTIAGLADSLPADGRDSFLRACDTARAALDSFDVWMRTDLLPRSSGNFRIGEASYRRKLAYTLQHDMTPEDILRRAEADLETTTTALYETCADLYPKLFGRRASGATPEARAAVIRATLRRLSDDRPTNTTIVEEARRTLVEAERFVRDHGIVTIPTDPVEIIVMPEFQRGVAVAYCDSPGPLEKNGKTFYAISPTPADWPKERVESFYREYNLHMLRNLTVHEAMPGHYLQLMTGNRFSARTIIRGLFPSGIFAEGWATYVEQVMADAGFGGPEMKAQQLKMRLRLIINAIIDQGVHMRGMSERDAMDLMMKRGFQEEGEASGKWRRACLTSAQLSTYYVGNLLMNDIRIRAEAHAGPAFSLKKFHDTVISFGTISPTYLPTLLRLPVPGPENTGAGDDTPGETARARK